MKSENVNEIIKTGHGMARFLKEYGVEFVFGNPDGHTLGFYDGLLSTEGIKHVLFNDERSACFAADAYARITGNLGVCDAGAVGAMNFPVALAEAKGSSSSVLAIIGVIKSHDELRNIPHDIKVAEVLAPVTKWTGKVLATEYLPRFMTYAVKQAVNGRPGPVALVISEDVISSSELKLKEFIPRVKGSCSINSCRISPPEGEIDQAIEMIRKARQPAIFSGGEALLSGAFYEILELGKILRAPVFSTISGKGIMLPYEMDNESLYFGTIGLFGEKPNHNFIRTKTDLVIVIGNRMTEDDTANFKIPLSTQEMIQIDIDSGNIGLNYHPWGIVGDPKAAVSQLITRLSQRGIIETPNVNEILKERLINIEKLRLEHIKYRESDNLKWMDKDPIKPQRILKAISDSFTKNDYLITDASTSSRWIGAYFPLKSIGRKIIAPRGVGPTGFGVGALIGTCIAVNSDLIEGKNSKKILFTGDGGLMNGGINEFETIKKLNLDCTIVIINNASLGFVKFGQATLYKQRYYETDRPNTDFSKLAEAFGGKGIRVERLSELDTAIKEAMISDGFNLVDVVVDPMEILPPSFY